MVRICLVKIKEIILQIFVPQSSEMLEAPKPVLMFWQKISPVLFRINTLAEIVLGIEMLFCVMIMKSNFRYWFWYFFSNIINQQGV